MKRINGAVEFEWDHTMFRLIDKGLEVKEIGGWDMDEYETAGLLASEDGRALLAEAIEALDHPFRTVNVSVPPHMRSTPRGNR